jgi:hypothetical protein
LRSTEAGFSLFGVSNLLKTVIPLNNWAMSMVFRGIVGVGVGVGTGVGVGDNEGLGVGVAVTSGMGGGW